MSSPEEILRRYGIAYSATRNGKFTTKCPACGHGYLNVEIKRDGVVWYCAGCKEGGGEKFDKKSDSGTGVKSPLGEPKAIYRYEDEAGELLFEVLRFEPLNAPKQFRQRRSADQKKWSIKDVRLVPYQLPRLIDDQAADRTVFVAEGEKDVDTLRAAGVPATCTAMGAGKFTDAYKQYFVDADVVIVGDHDEPGRAHVQRVADVLFGTARRIRILDLAPIWPDIEPSDDISDWFARGGGTTERLWAAVEALADYEPAASTGNGSSEPPPWDMPGLMPAAQPVHLPVLLSSAAFIRNFSPPEYLIDGVLQRRFFYSLTAPTGAGKTSILLQLAACVALRHVVGKYECEAGPVCFFAGENPDDVRMRWIAIAEHMGFDLNTVDVHFVEGVFPIPAIRLEVQRAAKAIGCEFALVIVDTSAAYFLGAEENSNVELGNHARVLRSLVTLPGGPTVIAACHPPKQADQDNLLPRGGGAFIAECDGNLVARKDGNLVELHWQGKYRGVDFDPIHFELAVITAQALKDRKGRLIPTVLARSITDAELGAIRTKTRSDEDALLLLLYAASSDHLSYGEMATRLGWFMADGSPYKSKVVRTVNRLREAKLVKRERNDWLLTEHGEKTAKKLDSRPGN